MAVRKKEFRPLTKAEELVMQALWPLEAAFIKDVIAAMPAPQPHYNTVSTLLKILEEKGFVASEQMGNANRFRVLVSKEEYSRRSVSQLLKGYFDGSFANLVSFFASDKDVDIHELEAILKTLKKSKG